ncbi:Ubiquinone biosynthesis protein [Cercospora beticola]|uniref:Ubiquinone biosynthesis protein n=2 Tax=Cercospora beticola TaxID=122368 RepID=A0A2G5HTU0_CERBT|nr:Ubiquinone biosynthesis protein [Cercospora beticola]PIA95946.1 Ubiquinone biosynthesis protein [Cercospora beticola]
MSINGNTMSLRTILRMPRALRPILLQQARCPLQRSCYHSYEHPEPPPYPEPADSILASALAHVPAKGFTTEALTLGAKDQGYLDITASNLFPKGQFELIRYYLTTERLGLKNYIQFPEPASSQHKPPGTGQKVRSLVLARLQRNIDTQILPHWSQALGHMSLAENIPASLKELGLLSDEIWFLAGDKSVDSSWYTKRASLSAVYAATEMFQTKDQSTEFKDTEEFLDRRLEEIRTVGGFVGGFRQWAGFQAGAVVNLLRSKGVRV